MKGWGKFKSPHEIEVSLLDGGTSTVKAKNTIIATGSEVTPLPGITIDEERCVLSSDPAHGFQRTSDAVQSGANNRRLLPRSLCLAHSTCRQNSAG